MPGLGWFATNGVHFAIHFQRQVQRMRDKAIIMSKNTVG